MRLLVLGGGTFVGPAVLDDALGRGWTVTTFNRGRTGPARSGVERLVGDRTRPQDLAVLCGREWDAVIDTLSGAPAATREVARVLAGLVGHYGYVSSRSVYRWPMPAGADESAPVVAASPDATDGDYAELKRGSELAVLEAFGAAALLARAGLVLGPRENIGRLPWWLRRLERGGRVLAPGPVDRPLQYVDARDLAGWMLDCAAAGTGGTFNAVSPPGHTTMGALLSACREVTRSVAELVWAPPAEILAAGIEPWTQLPIWVPPDGEYAGLHDGDTRRAAAAGLHCRPVRETVADTWAWLQEAGDPEPATGRPDSGLDPAVEERVLAAH